jgi:hypothetical protein
MTQMDSAQFEALWQSANTQPVSAPTQTQTAPVQIDLSLGAMLDQYLTMVGTYRDSGKVSQDDYNALAAAIADLKTILARIDDPALVTDAMAQKLKAVRQPGGGL